MEGLLHECNLPYIIRQIFSKPCGIRLRQDDSADIGERKMDIAENSPFPLYVIVLRIGFGFRFVEEFQKAENMIIEELLDREQSLEGVGHFVFRSVAEFLKQIMIFPNRLVEMLGQRDLRRARRGAADGAPLFPALILSSVTRGGKRV